MQDNSKDFDLLVRSILEDAEIKPSRRVWKAVSAQINPEEQKKRAIIRFVKRSSKLTKSSKSSDSSNWSFSPSNWAYGALAFAAALALIVFLRPSKQEIRLYSAGPLTAQKSEIELLPIAKSRPLLAFADRTETQTKSEIQEEVIYTDQDTDKSASNSSDYSNSAPKPLNFRDRYRSFNSDPFAELEQEEPSRKLGKTSIYAKGLISGNDSEGALYDRQLALMAPSTTETGITEVGSSSYGVPITLGLGVRFYIAPRLSIATGLDLSLLSRSFTGKYHLDEHQSEGGNVTHSLIYLGVPVNLYFDIFESNRLKFYTYAGGEIEYCISNKYTLHTTPKIEQSSKVRKPMYSVGAGLGVEFALTKSLGLYLDPGARYYFDSDQPRSIRTERAVVVNFDAGLRFNF